MNFRFEPYCENCEFVEPYAYKNPVVIADTGERFGDKMTITCRHAKLCRRLHQNIKAAEKVSNCSDEATLEACEVGEKGPEKAKNCSDEGSES